MSEGMGERRRRREAERAAQAPAPAPAGPPPVQAQRPVPVPAPAGPFPQDPGRAPMTRRELRAAERAGGVGSAPSPAGAPPPGPPGPVVRPPVATRRPGDSGPDTSPVPVVRVRPGADVTPLVVDRARTANRPAGRVWVATATVLAVLLLVTLALVLRDDGAATDGSAPVGAGAQRTLMITLVDGSDVTAAALLATDEEATASLLLPSLLLVDVPAGGRVALRDALDTGDDAPAQAVGDALGVRVDGTWVLATAGLAQLVDGVGGVVVDVDVQVTREDVVVPAGPGQSLGGPQAVAFATVLAEGETEPARLARVDQVLSGLLARLPVDAAALGARLAGLGAASRSTLPPEELAGLLAGVARQAAGGRYAASVVPFTQIAAGGEEQVYGLDDEAARQVVSDRFAGAVREGAQTALRVLVQNGAGAPGLGEQARTRLVDAGFRYVSGGNAETLDQPTTVVAIPDDAADSRDSGLAVAQALGLGPEVVAVGQDAPTLADVVVVLGTDFAAIVAGG